MITEQRIRNILESLTYKAAAGSTIAVEAIAVITELAKLRAEPPRPAAIVLVPCNEEESFNWGTYAVEAFEKIHGPDGALEWLKKFTERAELMRVSEWTWHARAAEGEAT
jgi:hypothetical protein